MKAGNNFIARITILMFCSSCALDTTGRFIGSDAYLNDIEEGKEEKTEEQTVEITAFCQPGNYCDNGGYCCNKEGNLGCFTDATDCDCGVSESICSNQGMFCCEVESGKHVCRENLEGCLCSDPYNPQSCGGNMICCKTEPSLPYRCAISSIGCICDKSNPSASSYCGSGNICCSKGDYSRCVPETESQDCLCTVRGFDPAECGNVKSYCCARDSGMKCGESMEGCFCSEVGDSFCGSLSCCDKEGKFICVSNPDGCECNSNFDCGSGGFFCCRKYYENRKFCHTNQCDCDCDDFPNKSCGNFWDGWSCDIWGYCDNAFVCWF